MNETSLAHRFATIRNEIAQCERESDRAPGSVRLIAVTKKVSAEMVRAAYGLGQRDFGENYAQELRDKAAALSDLPEIRWHFIGALQRNKVPIVVDHAHMLHTCDSEKLAETLNRRTAEANRAQLGVLLEINISGDSSKSGAAPELASDLARFVLAQKQLKLRGLMTIPSITEPERAFFALAKLRNQLETQLSTELPELSMGMSGDYRIAISAGATLVRIGTALFGTRQ